ncbi:DTW domain-containing protein [Blyttiomyces helicus]|uniref:tRNA-uridine aminocarboxypropyltransferase 1 n=1 Tax=Blyttiomyces helicus TaxID=388810 RepID=A0A4P9WJ56_9FUNG|nr:DTW domain-containing protein [Blyttiomyces helicus]|eukprot:RKO92085.1 DTW domain-containing protein [Blyttiomyces helicus]
MASQPPPPGIPFAGLKISPNSHLDSSSRLPCPNCAKPSKLFCPICFLALAHTPPAVSLPVKIDILRHPHEKLGKTTSTHARVLAPHDTEIVPFRGSEEDVEEMRRRYPDPSRVLLLFPSKVADATPLSSHPPSEISCIILLDGTWKQGRAMARSLLTLPFPRIRISSRRTFFWRYQPFGLDHLSTIEAVYWVTREYHEAFSAGATGYDGRFDDLLFYFKHNFELIQEMYLNSPGKRFTTRKLDSDTYIRRGEGEDDDGTGWGAG